MSGSGSFSTSITSKFATERGEKGCPLWSYVTILQDKKAGGGNASWKCNYCNGTYRGSYYRVKCHLLKDQGHGIGVCTKVTDEYLVEMRKIEREALDKTKPVIVSLPTGSTSNNPPKMEAIDGGKRRRGIEGPLAKAFNIEARDHLHAEIARLFYSAGLPFNVARNPYYVSAFSYAANTCISGFLPPSYNAIRTSLLQKEKTHVTRLLQPIKDTWPEKGVSIVTDGWTDVQRRPLINFMAISDAGPMFLKSVDCSGEVKDKTFISSEIIKVINEVGSENVVQIITDNAPVCRAAGMIIEASYPSIFWTPCVVHTLNLALKNICQPKNSVDNEVQYNECFWIAEVVEDVAIIKNFILNHSMRLAMYNQFVKLNLLAVADTRFASTIVVLKRFKSIKHDLQRMVISDEWVDYKDDDIQKAMVVKDLILNDSLWEKIDYVLKFTMPIYDMLRLCDTDTPVLHLVYEKWDSMIEQVKMVIYEHEGKELHEFSIFYQVVYDILIARWTKSCTPLHCLAHSLNPRYYTRQWLEEVSNRVSPHKDNEICEGRNKCLRRYFPDSKERLEVTKEFVKFSGTEGELGQYDCLEDRWDLSPKEWWIMHGSSIPKIQNLALKLLSQPCSSSCSERNWSTYSFIHSYRRNKLKPQRSEDLVFVHTNLRLLSRRTKEYNEGESKLWDVGGDERDPFEGAGILEVAELSLDEPKMEAVLFTDDGDGNTEIETVAI